MKEASRIQVGNILLISNELYKVLSFEFSGSAKAEKQFKVTMKSVPEGRFQERVFHPGEKVEDITPETKKAQYTYSDNENVYFMDEASFEQFAMPKSSFGEKILFLREGDVFNVWFFNDNPLDIHFPPRMRFKVASAPQAIHGSGSNVYKKIRLENDVEIDAPQFIKEGDMVEIDAETLKYIDRVQEDREKDEGGGT
jgi:elongation factor P